MDPNIAKKILDAIAADDPKAALEVLKEIATSLIGGAADAADVPTDPTAATADPPQPNPDEPPAQQSADRERLAALEKDLAELRERNAELDRDARRELIAELVRLGAETPATAWQRDAKGNATSTPVARLAGEPLREMRERVAVLAKSAPRRPVPPDRSDAPAYSPRVQTVVERMTPEQRERFNRYQQSLSANRKGVQ